MVRVKRAYEPKGRGDGHRVLVERLWPRGLRKEDAHVDEWLKDVAPSDALRTWFHHDPGRWAAFRQRYQRELDAGAAQSALEGLVGRAESGTVTLVYSSHDEEHNSALVLRDEIEAKLGRGSRSRKRAAAAPAAAHGRH